MDCSVGLMPATRAPLFRSVVSVGQNCLPAARIDMRGLRFCAYPFDAACSTPPGVVAFLERGADAFLAAPPEVTNLIGWPHHAYREQPEGLRRAERRLRDALAARGPVLLLHHVPDGVEQTDEQTVLWLSELALHLRVQFPATRVHIASVRVRVVCPLFERHVRRVWADDLASPTIELFEFATHARWVGGGARGPFLGTADEDLWTAFWRAFRIELARPDEDDADGRVSADERRLYGPRRRTVFDSSDSEPGSDGEQAAQAEADLLT